jgi:hypothetical protein
MSNWTTITEPDLKDAKLADLVEAYKTAALGDGQADPIPNVIANVVARIRAEIKGCAKNILDLDTGKIPTDLKSLAARMVCRELQSRLRLPLKDDERDERRSDERYLERIAKCEVPVAVPDNPETTATTQASTVRPATSTPARKFSITEQEGL